MGFGIPGFECWPSFCIQKYLFFRSFFEVPIFIDLERFGMVWAGSGAGLGNVWGRFGRVWREFGQGLGRTWRGLDENQVQSLVLMALGLVLACQILGSKMIFGVFNGAGMFKKCLGTFVWSFELMFLDVWGWCSKATGQNKVGPADRAQRSAAPPQVGSRVLNFKSKSWPKIYHRCSASKA